MFDDRADAARKLVDRLPPCAPADTVVIGLPRGGVPLAEIVADALGAALDIVLVRKVGLPRQPELAVAAVSDAGGMTLTINHDVARMAGLSQDDIRRLAEPELEEIARRRERYLGGRAPLPVKGKTVIVVDDGIATGATMRSALRLIRAMGPNRVILAVPVAPRDTLESLRPEVEEIVCLETPEPFYAVGAHYRVFEQTPDRVVTEILSRHPAGRGTAKSPTGT